MPLDDPIVTAHAAARLTERKISLDAVRDVIKYGRQKQKQPGGTHGGQVWRISKSVDGTTLVVVVEIKSSQSWLITAFEK